MGLPGGTQLRRPRVSRLLDALADRRLVAVVADAGSGKTVAVRDWLAETGRPVGWLTLTAEHAEPTRLLADLVAVTAAHCPGLADGLAPELAARAATDRAAALPPAVTRAADPGTPAAALAEALAAAWGETLATPFRLVLDDLHAVAGTAGTTFLADLVRLYPRAVQLTVIDRTPPPFGVERLRASGEYGELGQRALLFDPAETVALFAAFDVPIDEPAAATVTAACAGWATAVRLAVESALSVGTDRLREYVASPAAAAERLTAAVLTPLPAGVRRVLRAMAVLGGVPREVVADEAGELRDLDALAERGLLVTAVDRVLSLTVLARYALDLADPVDEVQRADVLRSAVDAARAVGLADPAVRWAVRLGDVDVVADVVGRFGTQLLDRGVTVPLVEAADLLADAATRDERLDALFAQLFARRGAVHRALDHLDRLDPDAALPSPVAWRVAGALYLQGESAHAAAVLARGAPDGAAADQALVAATRATLAWGRGDGAAGQRHADEALRLAERSGDDTALAGAWVAQALVAVLTGDMDRNRRAYETGLRHAQAAGDVVSEVRIRCNVGSQHNETGRYREALVTLADAVRLGEATGQRTLVALSRCNQGDARLGLGQLEEALQAYDDALAVWTDVDSPMAAHAHQGRGDCLARRGDTARAAAAYRRAVAVGEAHQDAQVLVPALAGLARVELAEDPAVAADLARRAVALPAAVGSLPAQLAAGWVALCTGDRTGAAQWARRAVTDAGRRNAPAALAQALLLAVLADPRARAGDGRLTEAADLLRELDDPIGCCEIALAEARLAADDRSAAAARARLRGLGVRDSAARTAGPLAVLADERAAAVVVRTLGSFVVLRAGTAVPASAWQSRKARDLVKILAARRGRAISREALAEWLWPGSDGTGNRLSVALSTARTVLDPEKTFPPERYLVADRGSVRLDLTTVDLDTEDFARRAEVALAAADTGRADAVALLEAAVAAYPGDFCEEDPYEGWAAQPRDELRARQHRVLRTLAELLATSPRPDAAVPWLITLLGTDPYDEPTHLSLVRTLVRCGRHGEARRAYRGYTERMAEIEVEPAAFPQPRPRDGAGRP
ncbi:ATP-, maltotriose-and DNA-dependent transcriptional regulator MalT [Jatrophihabitans endophyticus]|uniref:ATP-, maltotriose-and DNA-dependent transcriptional regulator MalT n=1 Tax=Jatrophihabitans endophyticus TaxID=1206085 RepID=A0A1M5KBI3_9ACTN|nr:BTAD domain-containing putative transcriptional regulator [Jatrophihabitans endophyticus]SHG50088.1 ATP-, maltotriose-and DNA-dependent transcriptional regulator MalT [Jatrophihabitans endophyticus]